MAFGQASGPPASGRQLKTLQELLENAGYTDFRDARGPLGFTQRQAGGKFTVNEADAYIAQLEQEAEEGEAGTSGEPEPAAPPAVRRAPVRQASPVPARPGSEATVRREARQSTLVKELPAKILARELERRGWILIPPEDATPVEPAPED
jgi:hypothetical protein